MRIRMDFVGIRMGWPFNELVEEPRGIGRAILCLMAGCPV